MNMNYLAMLKRLNLVNKLSPESVSMGLKNTKTLYNLVGQPLKNIPVIHVGGTNGKGSVCWKLASTLRLNGFKTGLFVSPHISSYRERIQVNNQLIDESTMANILPELFALCDKHNIQASFFELTTILALVAFEKAACDGVVLEVGCGG
jgi:dihydrofolate synthase/folylpolyglutamate synthase